MVFIMLSTNNCRNIVKIFANHICTSSLEVPDTYYFQNILKSCPDQYCICMLYYCKMSCENIYFANNI